LVNSKITFITVIFPIITAIFLGKGVMTRPDGYYYKGDWFKGKR